MAESEEAVGAGIKPVQAGTAERAIPEHAVGADVNAVASHVSAGRNLTSATIQELKVGHGSTVVINSTNLDRVLARAAKASAEPEWRDPSLKYELSEPLSGIPPAELESAVRQLRSQRILIVECVDSDLQCAAAAAVVRHLEVSAPTVCGALSGDSFVLGETIEETTDLLPIDQRCRWTDNDILHPRLGGGACFLFLELDGANGQGLIDRLFRIKWTFDAFCAELRRLDRYLILQPRGRAAGLLRRGHAQRGFVVKPLRIDFLEPWLGRRFPESAPTLAATIRQLVDRGEWSGSEEALYEWLCSEVEVRGGPLALEQLVDRNRDELPKIIHRLSEALFRSDGEEEPLVAASFVATWEPRLGQHDFCRAVEALLEGRTRTRVHVVRGATEPAAGSAITVEISLAKEWRDGLRSILRSAGLDFRPGPDGSKRVAFRDLGIASSVRGVLDDAPMFVEDQIGRVRSAGLLFDRSEPLSQAVIQLIAAAAAREPRRYDADWMLGLLLRAGPDVQDIPLTQQTAGIHLAELTSRQLSGAHDLLRRLIDDHVAGAATPDGARLAGSSIEARRPTAPIVHGVLEKLVRLNNAPAAIFALELAYRLRNAPDFDQWHWIRQILERGQEGPRKHAAGIIERILQGEESGTRADFVRLLSWMPAPGKDGGQAAITAANIVRDWAISSVQFVAGNRARSVSMAIDLLRKVIAGGGECVGATSLVSAVFHGDVLRLFKEQQGVLIDMIVGFVVPAGLGDLDALGGLGAWLQTLFRTWNEWVVNLAEDADGVDLGPYLIPTFTLAAWSELFAEQPEVLRAMAAHLRATIGASGVLAVRTWLGVIIGVLQTSEDQVLDIHDLDEGTQKLILTATDTRRKRIEGFQLALNEAHARGGADS